MKINKITKIYYEGEDGFKFTFEPVNDEVEIKKTKTGYEARYLVVDDSPMSPDECGDDNLFLVAYHRDCYINRANVSEDAIRSFYNGENTELNEKYHLFKLTAYIHGGIRLYLGKVSVPFDPQGWDTSQIGAVLASKKEFPDEEKARAAAESLVKEWNAYFSGDTYGLVIERYDKNKKPIDHDSVWGYIGHEFAKKELESFA